MELIISSALVFFLVLDPFGNLPLFLTALSRTAPERRKKVIVREQLIALAIMLAFLFGGQRFLQLFHISAPALSVGGGMILLLIALRMVFPTPDRSLKEPSPEDEPFIVPLAVPYLAGPSLLAMEIVMVSGNPDGLPSYLIALLASWLVSAIVLYFSEGLVRVVGAKALVAVERLMGMVLVIVATQMSLEGIAHFFSIAV
ncbi:MAG: NAAT family transporter [Propionibacterium sp.]|nr:NAAT family transporter [Propionibacterium sp.]